MLRLLPCLALSLAIGCSGSPSSSSPPVVLSTPAPQLVPSVPQITGLAPGTRPLPDAVWHKLKEPAEFEGLRLTLNKVELATGTQNPPELRLLIHGELTNTTQAAKIDNVNMAQVDVLDDIGNSYQWKPGDTPYFEIVPWKNALYPGESTPMTWVVERPVEAANELMVAIRPAGNMKPKALRHFRFPVSEIARKP